MTIGEVEREADEFECEVNELEREREADLGRPGSDRDMDGSGVGDLLGGGV